MGSFQTILLFPVVFDPFHSHLCLYSEHIPPSLEDITFSVQGGQKIGVVGRTGRYVSLLRFCT